MCQLPMRRASRFILLTLGLISSIALDVRAQQDFKIGKIEFTGLERLAADEVAVTTALKVGDRFDVAALDAAAQRLADSGLFKSVSYHTQANRDLITITFQVEERRPTNSRVVFDNFIWFSDSDLITAIQRDVPSFSGNAPDNGDIVERITKSLQRFLHENKIEATVNYMASQDAPGSTAQEHVFSVIGIPLPICTLHFPGATNLSEAVLIDRSKSLLSSDYSNKFVSLFAANTLIPNYRALGQLKATFAPPVAKPETSATCRSGVDVTLAVDEGLIYKWDKAEWAGNAAMSTAELDAILPLQSGQPADGIKLDKSIADIEKAYGRKGYLLARVQSQAALDDSNQKVVYKYAISEGLQFHMGKLSIVGLPPADARNLSEAWTMKSGDIYNQEYSVEFSRKQVNQVLRSLFVQRRTQGKPAPDIRVKTKINKDALTVDVTLELTN